VLSVGAAELDAEVVEEVDKDELEIVTLETLEELIKLEGLDELKLAELKLDEALLLLPPLLPPQAANPTVIMVRVNGLIRNCMAI
jgi:hypothetical protein